LEEIALVLVFPSSGVLKRFKTPPSLSAEACVAFFTVVGEPDMLDRIEVVDPLAGIAQIRVVFLAAEHFVGRRLGSGMEVQRAST
jgi:hypothetical protein